MNEEQTKEEAIAEFVENLRWDIENFIDSYGFPRSEVYRAVEQVCVNNGRK